MAEKAAEKNLERRRVREPRTAVSESKDGRLRVVLEMPGVLREDLHIRVEDNLLFIEGRRPAPADRRWLLRERPDGDFVKTFTLDETIDTSKIDAELVKGVLSLTLDLKEQVKPRTIPVRAE
jgi:HSP20 family protein